MRWFMPSWNGDFRVETDPENPKQTLLIMVDPTLGEQEALRKLGIYFAKKGWWIPNHELWQPDAPPDEQGMRKVRLLAPIAKVAAKLASVLKAGKQTLTAVKYSGGRLETVVGVGLELAALAERAEAKQAPAAATVKRATPSCPACYAGAVRPATEALLAFMDEEQHEQWAEHRYLVCRGGLSGHRYLLAHRHTPVARGIGRICFDLDTGTVLHFHDQSVPPEEEVLGAKLVLEHREPWLRNEATLFGVWGPNEIYDNRAIGQEDCRFKNPFGGTGDGTGDAALTEGIGRFLQGLGIGRA